MFIFIGIAKPSGNKKLKKKGPADKSDSVALELSSKDTKQSQRGKKTKAPSLPKIRKTQTKKVKENNTKSENGHLLTDASNFNAYSENNTDIRKASIKKLSAKKKQNNNEKNKRNKKSPIKLKLPRVLPPTHDLMENQSTASHSTQMLLQDGLPLQSLLPQTPLPLSAITSPSPSNYDLTDRDSVRQLLSSRG